MPSIRIDCDAARAETTDPDPGDEFTLDEPPEIPIYEGNYFGANGWWVTEMSGSTTVHRPIESWTVEDVATFVRGTSGARVSKKMSKKSTKIANLYASFANAIESDEINGELLVAIGPIALAEKVGGLAGGAAYDFSTVKVHAASLFKAISAAAKKGVSVPTELGDTCGSFYGVDEEICAMFDRTPLEDLLRRAMAPQPRDRIRFVRLADMDELNVPYCDERVSAIADNLDSDACEDFKVVSVSLAKDPKVVHRNMIYTNDEGVWTILASVDFAQHGESGPPGHWHVNRAPLAEFVPHWGPACSVYHGQPSDIPLWWLLVPKDSVYAAAPDRRLPGGRSWPVSRVDDVIVKSRP
eukprot:m.62368 g.62368  ORF g.62368 m.62368 type:complete len:354 (-) comp9611_c0_seq4:4336-5397(-)